MFIVLHCGGIPFNGETVKERSLGGSESAAYYLARHLADRGHQVSVFTKHEQEGVFDGVRYLYMGEQSNQFPMGDRYHFYCTNTPHDVNIAQRHPLAFQHRLASKVNLLWLHDIALRRNAMAVNATMWNVDHVMPVSEFHKRQIMDSWKLEDAIITPITNGVDRSLYEDNVEDLPDGFTGQGLALLYQSRPERGLENLVAEGGIMEQLLVRRPDARLYVCGYHHDVPEMQGLYDHLYQRIEALPNCVNVGHLPKRQLAALQMACDLLVYPTEFEEVSCITAMEAMVAGLPMVASKWAALPETCKGAGSILIDHVRDRSDIGRFVNSIAPLDISSEHYKKLVQKQRKAAEKYTWEATADQVEAIIERCFARLQSPVTVVKDLIRQSDIIAAEKYIEQRDWPEGNRIFDECIRELSLYRFADNEDKFREHYRVGTNAFYDGDFQKAGRETVAGSSRFECVAHEVSVLDTAVRVIDYGCAHGHYTIELARRNPDTLFVGIDISERAIAEATKWADDERIENIEWFVGTIDDYLEARQNAVSGDQPEDPLADAVIAAEVLEHVRNPHDLMSKLGELLRPGGKFILTTPYGPWEQMSYQKDHPTRFHLHHFERADLADLFGHHEGFDVKACPSGSNPGGDVVGQYVTTFLHDGQVSMDIDYERKFRNVYPRQTLSLCMIVKDCENTIGKALKSIAGYVDEVVIGLDRTTTDRTRDAIERFAADMHLWPVVHVIDIESPLVTGFDEARNATLDEATGDWIMWFDSDEEVIEPHQVCKLLRGNQFTGYPLPQTHFSIHPAEVLNTDYPVRLFRNDAGIRFFGVVHEHPETALNQGIGAAWIEQAPIFSHNGYVTEDVRRQRFDRNFPLMQRDREKYPDRILGKFLWVRDVAHACQFHLERNGGRIIPEMHEVAREALGVWEELLETDQLRMIEDSMKYYSLLCEVLGSDLSFGIRLGASRMNGGINLAQEREINCRFRSTDHIRRFTKKVLDEKVKGYETRHF